MEQTTHRFELGEGQRYTAKSKEILYLQLETVGQSGQYVFTVQYLRITGRAETEPSRATPPVDWVDPWEDVPDEPEEPEEGDDTSSGNEIDQFDQDS